MTAQQIIATARALSGEAGGSDNAAALLYLLGLDFNESAQLLEDALRAVDAKLVDAALQGIHLTDAKVRALAILTGIELGVAAERARARA